MYGSVNLILFQGVAMPAMNNMLSKWVPVAERSRSLALVYSGMYLGSVTGLAFSPFLIHQYGWPSVFFSFGSLGTVWFAVWLNKVSFAALLKYHYVFSLLSVFSPKYRALKCFFTLTSYISLYCTFSLSLGVVSAGT